MLRDTLNAFLEDTGLVTATAYLIARNRMLSSLYRDGGPTVESLRIGVVFGVIAMTEVLFPHDRAPYETDTMITTLTAVVGGTIPALVCAFIVSAVAFFVEPLRDWGLRSTSLLLAIMLARPFRRFDGTRYSLISGVAAGMVAEFGVLLGRYFYAKISGHYPGQWESIQAVAANGLGIGLMIFVFNDSWVRLDSEQHRLDAERAKAWASQAQLTALRARLHPHFLYNALTSIAGLCAIAPDKAQEATAQLGELMRRTLEVSVTSRIALRDELDNVRSYLSIEQNRLGPRLTVCWEIDQCDVQVPPLSVQTLVENAVNHGIAEMVEPGTLTIYVRNRHRYTLIAVKDDGPGMAPAARPIFDESDEKAVHGMQILSNQLILLYGRAARLRIASTPDHGAIVAFAIPKNHGARSWQN